jgi:hypothetical protein
MKAKGANRKMNQKNRSVKVHQVFDRPKQLRLDGGNDETLPRRRIRRIELEDEPKS